jgi:hypothetical protein
MDPMRKKRGIVQQNRVEVVEKECEIIIKPPKIERSPSNSKCCQFE